MNVISAWDVYWVMQLDAIGVAMVLISIVGMIIVGCLFLGWLEKDVPGFVLALITPAWGFALLLAIFLPSTKTAAAMIVLPAVANNETVQTEAVDLCRLAKKALADAVGEEPEAAQ